MRILFITSHAPDGPDHGARLRARNLLLQLAKLGEVHLVLAGSYEKFSYAKQSDIDIMRPIRTYDFSPWIIEGIHERFRYELGSSYLNTYGARAKVEDRTSLRDLIDSYDLVWVHGLRVANGFDLWRWPRSVLDIDDIPSEVAKTKMRNAIGAKEKLRAMRQFLRWRRHEARILERFDAMAVCSESDRERFLTSSRVQVIYNGFDVPREVPKRQRYLPIRIGFVGSLEYAPNAEGLQWFLSEVWPRIFGKFPDITLRIAGKYSERKEWSNIYGVEGLGWVDDLDGEVDTWALTIVPIFEGGGTRIKISTAFSYKCPVVSTALGAYGYEVSDGNEILIANSAIDFGTACIRILDDQELGERLSENAWNAFLQKWTWNANGPRIADLVQAALAQVNIKAL